QTFGVTGGITYYVNAAAASGGNGLSWGSAYQSLQNALSAAGSGDEIWVARGTYKPTTTTTRTIAFNLKSGVSLYGGFAGTEFSLEQRNWNSNPTILSGEIGSTALTDNSNHVISGSSVSDIVLDGFVIEKGYASSSNYGGGLYCAGVTNLRSEERRVGKECGA